MDDGGKYFYINENGKVWSPGWKPVKTPLDRYECRHGLGVEVLYMVPIGVAEVSLNVNSGLLSGALAD